MGAKESKTKGSYYPSKAEDVTFNNKTDGKDVASKSYQTKSQSLPGSNSNLHFTNDTGKKVRERGVKYPRKAAGSSSNVFNMFQASSVHQPVVKTEIKDHNSEYTSYDGENNESSTDGSADESEYVDEEPGIDKDNDINSNRHSSSKINQTEATSETENSDCEIDEEDVNENQGKVHGSMQQKGNITVTKTNGETGDNTESDSSDSETDDDTHNGYRQKDKDSQYMKNVSVINDRKYKDTDHITKGNSTYVSSSDSDTYDTHHNNKHYIEKDNTNRNKRRMDYVAEIDIVNYNKDSGSSDSEPNNDNEHNEGNQFNKNAFANKYLSAVKSEVNIKQSKPQARTFNTSSEEDGEGNPVEPVGSEDDKENREEWLRLNIKQECNDDSKNYTKGDQKQDLDLEIDNQSAKKAYKYFSHSSGALDLADIDENDVEVEKAKTVLDDTNQIKDDSIIPQRRSSILDKLRSRNRKKNAYPKPLVAQTSYKRSMSVPEMPTTKTEPSPTSKSRKTFSDSLQLKFFGSGRNSPKNRQGSIESESGQEVTSPHSSRDTTPRGTVLPFPLNLKRRFSRSKNDDEEDDVFPLNISEPVLVKSTRDLSKYLGGREVELDGLSPRITDNTEDTLFNGEDSDYVKLKTVCSAMKGPFNNGEKSDDLTNDEKAEGRYFKIENLTNNNVGLSSTVNKREAADGAVTTEIIKDKNIIRNDLHSLSESSDNDISVEIRQSTEGNNSNTLRSTGEISQNLSTDSSLNRDENAEFLLSLKMEPINVEKVLKTIEDPPDEKGADSGGNSHIFVYEQDKVNLHNEYSNSEIPQQIFTTFEAPVQKENLIIESIQHIKDNNRDNYSSSEVFPKNVFVNHEEQVVDIKEQRSHSLPRIFNQRPFSNFKSSSSDDVRFHIYDQKSNTPSEANFDAIHWPSMDSFQSSENSAFSPYEARMKELRVVPVEKIHSSQVSIMHNDNPGIGTKAMMHNETKRSLGESINKTNNESSHAINSGQNLSFSSSSSAKDSSIQDENKQSKEVKDVINPNNGKDLVLDSTRPTNRQISVHKENISVDQDNKDCEDTDISEKINNFEDDDDTVHSIDIEMWVSQVNSYQKKPVSSTEFTVTDDESGPQYVGTVSGSNFADDEKSVGSDSDSMKSIPSVVEMNSSIPNKMDSLDAAIVTESDSVSHVQPEDIADPPASVVSSISTFKDFQYIKREDGRISFIHNPQKFVGYYESESDFKNSLKINKSLKNDEIPDTTETDSTSSTSHSSQEQNKLSQSMPQLTRENELNKGTGAKSNEPVQLKNVEDILKYSMVKDTEKGKDDEAVGKRAPYSRSLSDALQTWLNWGSTRIRKSFQWGSKKLKPGKGSSKKRNQSEADKRLAFIRDALDPNEEALFVGDASLENSGPSESGTQKKRSNLTRAVSNIEVFRSTDYEDGNYQITGEGSEKRKISVIHRTPEGKFCVQEKMVMKQESESEDIYSSHLETVSDSEMEMQAIQQGKKVKKRFKVIERTPDGRYMFDPTSPRKSKSETTKKNLPPPRPASLPVRRKVQPPVSKASYRPMSPVISTTQDKFFLEKPIRINQNANNFIKNINERIDETSDEKSDKITSKTESKLGENINDLGEDESTGESSVDSKDDSATEKSDFKSESKIKEKEQSVHVTFDVTEKVVITKPDMSKTVEMRQKKTQPPPRPSSLPVRRKLPSWLNVQQNRSSVNEPSTKKIDGKAMVKQSTQPFTKTTGGKASEKQHTPNFVERIKVDENTMEGSSNIDKPTNKKDSKPLKTHDYGKKMKVDNNSVEKNSSESNNEPIIMKTEEKDSSKQHFIIVDKRIEVDKNSIKLSPPINNRDSKNKKRPKRPNLPTKNKIVVPNNNVKNNAPPVAPPRRKIIKQISMLSMSNTEDDQEEVVKFQISSVGSESSVESRTTGQSQPDDSLDSKPAITSHLEHITIVKHDTDEARGHITTVQSHPNETTGNITTIQSHPNEATGHITTGQSHPAETRSITSSYKKSQEKTDKPKQTNQTESDTVYVNEHIVVYNEREVDVKSNSYFNERGIDVDVFSERSPNIHDEKQVDNIHVPNPRREGALETLKKIVHHHSHSKGPTISTDLRGKIIKGVITPDSTECPIYDEVPVEIQRKVATKRSSEEDEDLLDVVKIPLDKRPINRIPLRVKRKYPAYFDIPDDLSDSDSLSDSTEMEGYHPAGIFEHVAKMSRIVDTSLSGSSSMGLQMPPSVPPVIVHPDVVRSYGQSDIIQPQTVTPVQSSPMVIPPLEVQVLNPVESSIVVGGPNTQRKLNEEKQYIKQTLIRRESEITENNDSGSNKENTGGKSHSSKHKKKKHHRRDSDSTVEHRHRHKHRKHKKHHRHRSRSREKSRKDESRSPSGERQTAQSETDHSAIEMKLKLELQKAEEKDGHKKHKSEKERRSRSSKDRDKKRSRSHSNRRRSERKHNERSFMSDGSGKEGRNMRAIKRRSNSFSSVLHPKNEELLYQLQNQQMEALHNQEMKMAAKLLINEACVSPNDWRKLEQKKLQDMLDSAYPLAHKRHNHHHSARSKQSTNSAQESTSLPLMSPTPPSQTGSDTYPPRPHGRRSVKEPTSSPRPGSALDILLTKGSLVNNRPEQSKSRMSYQQPNNMIPLSSRFVPQPLTHRAWTNPQVAVGIEKEQLLKAIRDEMKALQPFGPVKAH